MKTRNHELEKTRLLAPFFAQLQKNNQTSQVVYSATCCDRLYVGMRRPDRCRTCSKPLPVLEHPFQALGGRAPEVGVVLDFAVLHLKKHAMEVVVATSLAQRKIHFTWPTDQDLLFSWVETVSLEAVEQDTLEKNPGFAY